jgi:hypothetical protein
VPGTFETLYQDINIRPAEGHRLKVFLSYSSGGNGPPVTDLRVRVVPPAPAQPPPLPPHTTAQGYMIGNTSLQLLVTRGHGCPILALELYRAPNAFKPFSDQEKLDLAPHLPVTRPHYNCSCLCFLPH